MYTLNLSWLETSIAPHYYYYFIYFNFILLQNPTMTIYYPIYNSTCYDQQVIIFRVVLYIHSTSWKEKYFHQITVRSQSLSWLICILNHVIIGFSYVRKNPTTFIHGRSFPLIGIHAVICQAVDPLCCHSDCQIDHKVRINRIICISFKEFNHCLHDNHLINKQLLWNMSR